MYCSFTDGKELNVPDKTEQELREQLGELDLYLTYDGYLADKDTTKILTLIKEALPELAKEAGWIDPSKVIKPGEFGTPKAKEVLAQWAEDNGYVPPDRIVRITGNEVEDFIEIEALEKWAETNGYVKLADNQTPPIIYSVVNHTDYNEGFFSGEHCQLADMLKAGWRKVEVKDGS